MPREILLRDLSHCIDCQLCVTACRNRHGQTRMTMRGEFFGRFQLPAVCLHCDTPACVKICPYNVMRLDNGRTFVAPDCRGCRQCMTACPHTAIVMKQVETAPNFFEAVRQRFVSQTIESPAAQIATDGGRCVQCGICSSNCPVGVNVKAFARHGLPVTDDRCVQCGLCIDACPRRTLSWQQNSTAKMQADKCDLCRGYGQSACVSECPTGAMIRVTDDEAIRLVPELGCKLAVNGRGKKLSRYHAPPVRKWQETCG